MRQSRTGLIVALSVGGGVLLLLVVAAIVGVAVGIASHAPGKQVDAYLRALVDGRASAAFRIDGTRVTEDDVLLADKTYARATDRIEHYRIGSAVVQGDRAAVTARVKQGPATYSQTFTLVKAGKDLLIFDRWKLRPVKLATTTIEVDAPGSAAVTVAGAHAVVDNGTVSLLALPGSYPVDLSDETGMFTANPARAIVAGFGSGAAGPVTLAAKLTDEGKSAVDDAIDAYVDGCAASADLTPDGCSFGVSGAESGDYTYTDRKWTIDPRPTWEVGDWTPEGWTVTTVTPGAATFAANYSGAGETGTATAGPLAVRVEGTVTFNGAEAVFTSTRYY